MNTKVEPTKIKDIIILYEDGTELVVRGVAEKIGKLAMFLINQSGLEWEIKRKQRRPIFLRIRNFFKIV